MFDAGVDSNDGLGATAYPIAAFGKQLDSDRCDQLNRRLKRIAKARGSLDIQEAEALREADKLQLWRRYGHNSLVQYLEMEMGYTARAAVERIRVANILPSLPKIAEAIQNGELPFSGARELTRVATPETEEVWLGAVADKNVREVEAVVSGHARGDLPTDPPDPKLQRVTMWLSVRPETKVSMRQVQQLIEKQRGERVDEDAVQEAMCRFYLALHDPQGEPRSTSTGTTSTGTTSTGTTSTGTTSTGTTSTGTTSTGTTNTDAMAVQPVSGAAPYRVAVTTCKQCKRGWQHGAGVVEEMSPPAVERALCDAQMIGDVNNGAVERAKQTIPPGTRRAVLHRDQGRCRVPGCTSSCNIDVHHIWWLSLGGTHDMANLICLCEGHHLALHDGSIRIELVNGEPVFHNEGRNKFTRTTREVETKEALKARGFDRDRVRALIVAKTITHVGSTNLTAAQWLAIALRYADVERGRG